MASESCFINHAQPLMQKSRVDLGNLPLDLEWSAFMTAFKESLKSKIGEKQCRDFEINLTDRRRARP